MEQLSRRTTAAAQVSLARLIYYFLKRVVDIVGGSLLLVLFSPLILTIALVIWLDDGVPIVYRCQRLGRFGQPITVFKFRTMRDGSHKHLEELLTVDEERRLEYGVNRKLRNDPRRTRIGGFLRRASLDELRNDEVVAEALGEHVFERFVEAKTEEWDAYRMQVSAWELDRYLEAF